MYNQNVNINEDVKLFEFPPEGADTSSLKLRSIAINGDPWFLATDISAALGFKDAFSAVRHLDEDERANLPLGGFSRGAIAVNESGLYSLIMRSRKPNAKAFRKWVTSVVLPSLRKDGVYIAGQEKPITDELTLPELQAQMEAIQEKVDAIKAATMLGWARHREEKEARRDGFRLLKGRGPRVRS